MALKKKDTKKVENKMEEIDGLEISMPKEMFDEEALKRLHQIVENKKELFKRAFKCDDIKIVVEDDKVSFPWFKPEANCVDPYTKFISKLCALAIKNKRVIEKQSEIVNEKFEFRCFLLRLGFIGKEYSYERKFLLKNLEGSSAFKNGAKKVETK